MERILKPACLVYVPGFSSVEKALATFPFSLTWGSFFRMKYGNRCERSTGNMKHSTSTIYFYLFVHSCLDYFQTEFEAAHKINMVKTSPQIIITEL